MFSLVNDIVLQPLPFPHADRLVSVFESNSSRGWATAPVSVPTFRSWSGRSRAVRPIAAVRAGAATIADRSDRDVVPGAVASAVLFRMMGNAPLIGRGFTEAEDNAGAPCVVMLSHQYWVTRFDSDRALIGESLSVDYRACTVIGVVPDMSLPDVETPSVWLPFGVGLERWRQQGIASKRDQGFLTVFGKLAPGTTLNQARAEMSSLAAELASSYPNTNEGYGAAVVPLEDRVLGSTRPALLMLFGAGPTDPLTFGVIALLLAGVALVAAYLPTRRALRVDPTEALRAE